TNQPISCHCSFPWSRAQRHSGWKNFDRYSRLQRLGAGARQNRKTVPHCRAVARLCQTPFRDQADKDAAATTCQASTSALVRVGETQRTALIASKMISENGSVIEAASSPRVAAAILL